MSAAVTPERVGVDVAAAILGVPIRTAQALALRGDLPGCCKIGKKWTFNADELRAWVRRREAETWRASERGRQSTSAGVSGGPASLSLDRNIDDRYAQIRKALRSGGQTNSTPRR